MGKAIDGLTAKHNTLKLFEELRSTLYNIDQWIEPTDELYLKLHEWHVLTIQPSTIGKASLEVTTNSIALSKEEIQESDDKELLTCILSLHKSIRYVGSKIEKLIVVQNELEKAQGEFGYMYYEALGSNYDKLTYLLKKKEDIFLLELSHAIFRVPENEVVDSTLSYKPAPDVQSESNTFISSKEQTLAYVRVSSIFEEKGRAFWSGSLSDFVYAIDTLARNGYLKREELEEGLADTFGHKPMGKGKVQKITSNKIKDRRRALKSSSSPHKASTEIIDTMSEILEGMPSKTKKG